MKKCEQKNALVLPIVCRKKTCVEEVCKKYEVAKTPTEGKCFDVSFNTINQSLFEKEREDNREETIRQFILEAFEEVKKNPDEYAEPFQTFMPLKNWHVKTGQEIVDVAELLGGYNGNWVEQGLEWAQRRSNGESWKQLCVSIDTASWFRVVVWKNGELRLIGGSVVTFNYLPSTDVDLDPSSALRELDSAIPFVVFKRRKT